MPPLESPSFLYTCLAVASLCGMWLLAYVPAARAYRRATARRLMPWQLLTLHDELRGLRIRARRGLPGFYRDMQAVQALGLPSGFTPLEVVEEAATRVLTGMLLAGAAYPQSQHEAVLYLVQEAQEFFREQLAFQERLEKEYAAMLRAMEANHRQEAEINQRHAAHNQSERARNSREAEHPRTPPTSLDWRKVLGVSPDERDMRVIKHAYRKKAFRVHPDKGGSEEEMALLNSAMGLARKALESRSY